LNVHLDEKALKDLSKIDKKEAAEILSKIETLKEFPNISNIKRLTNYTPRYRLRIGKYRALFDIDMGKLTVYRVLARKESYK